jgi:hypothetical protein
MTSRFAVLAAAALAAFAAAPASAATACYQSLRHDDLASLTQAKCTNDNELVFLRGGIGGEDTVPVMDAAWSFTSLFSSLTAEQKCRLAAKGLEQYLTLSADAIEKLNAAETLTLPPGVVYRETLGGTLRAYGNRGSCAALGRAASDYSDCRARCDGLEGAAADQRTCAVGDKTRTCAEINDPKNGEKGVFAPALDFFGNEEVDQKKFAEDLIALGRKIDGK